MLLSTPCQDDKLNSMKIVPIDQIPLREDVVPIPADLSALAQVCEQMQELCKKEVGVGLSAFQVGLPWRFFVMKAGMEFLNLVDCEYEGLTDEKITSTEGCLSLRSPEGKLKQYDVERFKEVRVFGKQLFLDSVELKDFDVEYSDFQGIVVQHEIDHQFGILISDIGEFRGAW